VLESGFGRKISLLRMFLIALLLLLAVRAQRRLDSTSSFLFGWRVFFQDTFPPHARSRTDVWFAKFKMIPQKKGRDENHYSKKVAPPLSFRTEWRPARTTSAKFIINNNNGKADGKAIDRRKDTMTMPDAVDQSCQPKISVVGGRSKIGIILLY
jgi:hypothetical protein